ncbi:unnamed protein product [Calypogeia fissa]
MSHGGTALRFSRESMIDIEEDHMTKGKEEAQSLEVDSSQSDAQLLYLLHDKKTAASDLHAFIKELHADVDLHPITILTALGVDFTRQLGDCYHFFSWTRYPRDKAVFTRDRLTRDGRHGWSQGGGKYSITDGNQASPKEFIIGWKRKFTFMEKPLTQKKSQMMIGPKSYSFKLEEMVTVEDEEQERITASERTPDSFICVYRLFPTMHSKISRKYLQRWGPYTYRGPDAQPSPLNWNSPGEASPRASDPGFAPASPLNVEVSRAGEISVEPSKESIVSLPVQMSESSLKIRRESPPEVEDKDLSLMRNHPELGTRIPETGILYDPEEWRSPQLIYIPGLEERCDREWMRPFVVK